MITLAVVLWFMLPAVLQWDVGLDLFSRPCMTDTSKSLCLGVRSDARPFSYKPGGDARTDADSGPLSAAGYTGYMIRICDAVLQQMMLEGDISADQVGYVDIDVDRTPALQKQRNEGSSRLGLLGEEFDILCDPATITNDRRNGYIVSPPLYLTGISFLQPSGQRLDDDFCAMFRKANDNSAVKGLIGLVGGTTAASTGVEALISSGVLPELNDELKNYLAGRKICEGAVQHEQFVMTFPTHAEAAAAFCGASTDGEPPPTKSFLYYLGDLEIITANANNLPGCRDFEDAKQTYTNDRYAIFAKSYGNLAPGDEHLGRARLIARFFEILTRKVVFSPSLLDEAFRNTFKVQRPSDKLDLFFWSIQGELK